MSVIYATSGKAKEYCEFALNLFNGCTHGCAYCYAPRIAHKTSIEFQRAVNRAGVLEHLSKEAVGFTGKEVHLCFMTDPYMFENGSVVTDVTSKAIAILHKHSIKVVILTKGGIRSERDFKQLAKNKKLSKYGATLTFINDADSIKWEPKAALPAERIATLKKAHELGIETWASLEPVIDTKQSLELIDRCKDFVDTFKVGKLNHDKEANKIDWKKFYYDAVNLLEKNNSRYYIKNDLRAYA